MTTPSLPAKPVRHPRFYYDDGSLILLCDGVLYKVHHGIFAKRSVVFHDMLLLPQDQEKNGLGGSVLPEGSTDDNPVVITYPSKEELDHLMVYFYESYVQAEPTLDYLLSILKLSHFYLIDDGLQFSIHGLKKYPLTAALRMHIALRYDRPQWIEPAFRDLVARPCKDFTLEEVSQMGMEAYFSVTRTQCRLDHLVKTIAFWAPQVEHTVHCYAQDLCEATWEEAWWSGYARLLLHPDRPADLYEAVMELETTDIPGFDPMCKVWTLDAMRNNSAFAQSEEIIREGIKALGGPVVLENGEGDAQEANGGSQTV